MTKPPECPEAERPAWDAVTAFHGIPLFVDFEREPAAIEQGQAWLAVEAIEAWRDGVAVWPDRGELCVDESAVLNTRFDALPDQIERMAGEA